VLFQFQSLIYDFQVHTNTSSFTFYVSSPLQYSLNILPLKSQDYFWQKGIYY
jgi:hypothetical protein